MTKVKIDNNYWVMRSMPDGSNFSECFELEKENSIEIPKGSILTKNIYLSTSKNVKWGSKKYHKLITSLGVNEVVIEKTSKFLLLTI